MNGLSLSAANKFPHEEIWGLYIKSPTLEGNSLSQTKSANNRLLKFTIVLVTATNGSVLIHNACIKQVQFANMHICKRQNSKPIL